MKFSILSSGFSRRITSTYSIHLIFGVFICLTGVSDTMHGRTADGTGSGRAYRAYHFKTDGIVRSEQNRLHIYLGFLYIIILINPQSGSWAGFGGTGA